MCCSVSAQLPSLAFIHQQIPNTRHGTDVELLPLKMLHTFRSPNYFELVDSLKRAGKPLNPKILYIANGVYDLSLLNKLVNDNSIIKQLSDNTFISYVPIYLANNASLIINNEELRLSLADSAFIVYRGDFFVVDSTITSWDELKKNYGPRPKLSKTELLMLGNQHARPFLTGMGGSTSYFANSNFIGLGYQGRSSSFGLSLSTRISGNTNNPLTMYWALADLPGPKGYLIGNTISRCFFGFFSNQAGDVYLLGNVFHHNIIYNVDPHDYTNNIVIAHNISYAAQHSHGIILSREVNHAQIHHNLVFSNAGAGIMLDRNSEHAVIANNIVFNNKHDGIAIFESDHNQLNDNLVFANHNDGILIRNSLGINLLNNSLLSNGQYGTEVATQDLSLHVNRDFTLDPYQQRAQASIINNRLTANLKAAVAAKNNPSVFLQKNDYSGSGASVFAAELDVVSGQILETNLREGYRYCPRGDDLCDW